MKKTKKNIVIEKTWFDKYFLDRYFPYLWITIFGILVYAKALTYEFVNFDDNQLIIDNFHIIKDIKNIFTAFTNNAFFKPLVGNLFYRPMLTVSLILDAQVSGTNPLFYHFTNILIHLVSSCLVFLFLIRMEIRRQLAFLFSIIFAVHPILSQAVSWIPGRNDTLLAIFLLPTFLFFLDYVEKKEIKYLILHTIFFAVSLFTKETALSLIIICPLYYYFKTNKSLSLKEVGIFAIIWVSIFVFWFYLRSFAVVAGVSNPPAWLTIISLIWNLPGVVLYFGKIFIPFGYSVMPTVKDSSLIPGLIAMAFLIIALIVSKEKEKKSVSFGFLWFFVFLLPSLSQAKEDLMTPFFDHRSYVPILGLFIVLSEIDFIKNFRIEGHTKNSNAKNYGNLNKYIFILPMLLGIINIVHSENFRNPINFWTNVVINSPNIPEAHNTLGKIFDKMGRIEDAEREFRETIKINPKESLAHSNLGLILGQKGDFVGAEKELFSELENNPKSDTAMNGLGLVYSELGRWKDAGFWWKKALDTNKNNILLYYNMSLYHFKVGEMEKAREYMRQFLALGGKPDPQLLKELKMNE